jgi:predicted PurR-regulated permease PerM
LATDTLGKEIVASQSTKNDWQTTASREIRIGSERSKNMMQTGSKGPHLWEIRAVVDAFLLFILAAAIGTLYALRGIFIPLLVAFGLAYLFNPLITSLEKRWRMPRPLSITLLLLLLTVGATAFVAWLGPLLIQQAQTLATKAPEYIRTLGGRHGIELNEISEQVLSWTSRFQEDPLGALQPIFMGTSQALGFIGAVIGTTSYVAMMVLLIPMYFFMFAWNFERMSEYLVRFIPASHRGRTLGVLRKIDESVFDFFRGRLLVGVITAVLYATGWALTDVPYWFLLGAMTGLLTIIPYVSLIGWPMAIILKYVDSVGSGHEAGWLSVIVFPSLPYLVVQFVESWWLTPWIQGRTNDLSAVTVIVVVLVGGSVGGLLGMLLAIPLASIVKILFHEFMLPQLEAWSRQR